MFGFTFIESLFEESNDISEARKLAFENSLAQHQKNKVAYDKNHQKYNFKLGDLVYVARKNRINQKKLDPIRTGPHKILNKFSDTLYEVKMEKRKN